MVGHRLRLPPRTNIKELMLSSVLASDTSEMRMQQHSEDVDAARRQRRSARTRAVPNAL